MPPDFMSIAKPRGRDLFRAGWQDHRPEKVRQSNDGTPAPGYSPAKVPIGFVSTA